MENNLFIYKNTLYENKYGSEISSSAFFVSGDVEISMVIDGCGIHRILNREIECKKGDLFVIGSGISHGYFAEKENSLRVLSISFKPFEILSDNASDSESECYCCGVFRDKVPISYAMLNAKAFSEINDMFSMIVNEAKEKKHEWMRAVKAEITMLLIKISRYINLADTLQVPHSKEWIIVSAAMREIMDKMGDKDITLESIASCLLVSKSYLSKIFKNTTGEYFADYVRNLRINLACNLLKTTNLTNEEIVKKCGLKDVPSFYRLFKAEVGQTPNQYRMSQQTDENDLRLCTEISENIINGNFVKVKDGVKNAVASGFSALQILNDGLLSGMEEVGKRFKKNEFYVSDVLMSARAMNGGIEILKPYLAQAGSKARGKVCIGTVHGDLHNIGKNLVKIMMEGKGLEVVDLGIDVLPETFVQTAIEQNCDVICCSALITTNRDVMAEVVKLAKEAGIRDKVKIMIGGTAVNEDFCRKIGADKYTEDAASAAEAAVNLLQLY